MEEPSVKGLILQRSWSHLRSLLEEGRVSREELEVRLGVEELAVLDGKLEPSLWYPMSLAETFTQLIGEITGETGPPAWVERGRAIAEVVLENPHLKGFFEQALQRRAEQIGPTLTKMSPLLINFGELTFQSDEEGFRVILDDAGPLPEMFRYVVQGLVAAIADRVAEAPIEVSSERPRVDTITFHGRVA